MAGAKVLKCYIFNVNLTSFLTPNLVTSTMMERNDNVNFLTANLDI